MTLGGGFGLGYAMSNCQHDFRRVESVYLRPVKVHVPACVCVCVCVCWGGGGYDSIFCCKDIMHCT